jgi:CHAT domain-containing protein/tetratricopeptide repeat protein
VLILAFLVVIPTLAQESRWKDLDVQVEQLQKQGKNKEALPVAHQALNIAEGSFGAEHPNTATAVGRLGVIYSALGKYPEAEPLLERCVTIREEYFGPQSLPVADVLNALGELDYSEGKYTKAEAIYKRALERAVVLMSATLPSNPASGTLSRDVTERGACDPAPPAGGVLCPLPGTATEVQSIGELLRGKNWRISSYQDEHALEEVVKSAERPRVLHVATHGFFLSDQQVKRRGGLDADPSGFEDPMLRSGLFFAGADRTLKGEPPVEGVENGVLTAYEAMTLNLQGTELVVLSACETGRGHVQNGEGVFGLPRALQEAGSEAVLMSLWSVPDRETQELMTLFYRNWLSGMEKPQALRRAQITEEDQVRKRYGKDLPYYWGAFILVSR